MRTSIILAMLLATGLAPAVHGESLENGFVNPPDSAKPQVMWMWMDGNVSNEGVTTDLEAMKEVGLGGVLQFDLSGSGARNPPGPVTIFSDAYWSAIRQAFAECERLGLEFNKFRHLDPVA